MTRRKGKLYLLPNFIGESKDVKFICLAEIEIIRNLHFFITESKSALFQLLKKCCHPDLDNIEWIEFNEHHTSIDKEIYDLFHQERDIGLVSDAGLPSMADPGYKIVRYAHEKNYWVIPLPGPGSVYMAIMASGLNAQRFVFHGYLPRESHGLSKKIKEMEKEILKNHYAHFFIEAPYRNQKMLETITNSLPDHFLLHIACDVLSENEFIQTKKISEWKKNKLPEIQKRPCIFGLGF
jgi:16S rRNA (cytidine1402-2'-O)-methyltransferase